LLLLDILLELRVALKIAYLIAGYLAKKGAQQLCK
jgi:hypothetical protein